jgi:hypothetical protein
MARTIHAHFPDFKERIAHISDPRGQQGKIYTFTEIILSTILMFVLKEGSRNSYNQDRDEHKLRKNIHHGLGIHLAHGDTCHKVLALLDSKELETLKTSLIKTLIEKKLFYQSRLFGEWYVVAIDATGTHSYEVDYSGECLHKTSKNGVTSYSHAVLEARLVTEAGFSISLVSEWMDNNSDKQYDKQDCEIKAFQRIAKKLKASFPRLPMIIVADGLYPCEPFMETCKKNQWQFEVVLKDDSLKTLQEEIFLRPDKITFKDKAKGKDDLLQTIVYLNDLDYKGYSLSWLQLKEANNKFVWISSLPIRSEKEALALANAARLRWKIENEGFNTEKNQGYALSHKYSRTSYNALKNYYQCLQIAHLIDQLVLLSAKIKEFIKDIGKITIKKMFERMRMLLITKLYGKKQLAQWLSKRCQIRYT